jgi:apolipoprotein D and lipocalin family protein
MMHRHNFRLLSALQPIDFGSSRLFRCRSASRYKPVRLSTEKRCNRDITSTYTLNEYGHLLAERQCLDRDAKQLTLYGEAYPVNEPRYSKFKLSFMPEAIRWLPLGQNDYWILKLDDQYQMALIGEPSREALWLLSRHPHPDQAVVQQYLNYAKTLGYKVDDVVYTAHQK